MADETAPAIRRARADDVPAIVLLVKQLGHPVPDERTMPVAQQLVEAPDHVFLVAEQDGAVVGFLNMNMRLQLHHGGVVGTIDEMVVDEDRRGAGIGGLLVAAAVGHARGEGADAIDVVTGLRRVETVRFYESQSFEHVASMMVRRLGSRSGC